MVAISRIKNIIIGKTFKAKRENLGLSRTIIAHKLEIKPQFVANWERGQCLPPKKVIPQLMEIYNMSSKDVVNLYTEATKISMEEYFRQIQD